MIHKMLREPQEWLPALPWEGPPVPRWMIERPQEETIPSDSVAAVRPQVERPSAGMHLAGPGCKAADSCLLVHGYLVHLAEGQSGFGVLKIGKERLEEGALGAARMGQDQLAAEMREVALALPEVHTAEQAAVLAPKLKELSDQTWDLGRRCGGHLSSGLLQQARSLGAKVQK